MSSNQRKPVKGILKKPKVNAAGDDQQEHRLEQEVPVPNAFERKNQPQSSSSSSGGGGDHHGGIVWDEATIAEHDRDRGTRMKIDEPKTPYNGASDHEISTDDEKSGASPRGAGVMSSNGSPGKRWDEFAERLDAVSQQQQAGYDVRRRGGAGSESSDDDSEHRFASAEEEAKHKEFLKHRKSHYDEGRKLKALLAKKKANAARGAAARGEGNEDDDADDEDSSSDDDSEQPPPGANKEFSKTKSK